MMVLNLNFTIRILGYCYGNNTITKISVGFFSQSYLSKSVQGRGIGEGAAMLFLYTLASGLM